MTPSLITITILFDKPPGGEIVNKLFYECRTLGATRCTSVGTSKWKLIFENPACGRRGLEKLIRQIANKYGIMLK